jgi:hypothetical protein
MRLAVAIIIWMTIVDTTPPCPCPSKTKTTTTTEPEEEINWCRRWIEFKTGMALLLLLLSGVLPVLASILLLATRYQGSR